MVQVAAERSPEGVVAEVHPEAVADLVDYRAVQAVASLGVCPAGGLVDVMSPDQQVVRDRPCGIVRPDPRDYLRTLIQPGSEDPLAVWMEGDGPPLPLRAALAADRDGALAGVVAEVDVTHAELDEKKIPRQREESKFYNSTQGEIMEILNEISMSNVRTVYIVVDKYDYTGRFYELHGNSQYEAVLRELLAEAFAEVKGGDANVFLDCSSFVILSSFRAIAREIAASAGCNLKKCDKVTSHQNRCVQIADYVAGAINRNYEDGDPHYMDVIREKVSIARKD